MIAVVDYHKGNLKSVERGLIDAGGDARITDDAAQIARADAIVLPGVGAFADAVESMNELGQAEAMRRRIEDGVPFLGICLGLQLMFAEGDEGAPKNEDGTFDELPSGLNLIPGCVSLLDSFDEAGNRFKVPHVGWNSIEFANADDSGVCTSPLFANIPNGEFFYFTHSYVVPANDFTIATTTHSRTFPSAVQLNPVAFGVQFHPEKSSDAGARVMRNFVNICASA